MAEVSDADRDRLWEEWLAGRPDAVAAAARRVPPWRTYRLKPTGQIAVPLAYAEDGTVRAFCWHPFASRDLGWEVFGLSPNDFEVIEGSTDEQ